MANAVSDFGTAFLCEYRVIEKKDVVRKCELKLIVRNFSYLLKNDKKGWWP